MAISAYVRFTVQNDETGEVNGIGVLLILPFTQAIPPKPNPPATDDNVPVVTLKWNNKKIPEKDYRVDCLAPTELRAFWYLRHATEVMTGTFSVTIQWKGVDRRDHEETVSFSAGTKVNDAHTLTIRPYLPRLHEYLYSPLTPVETERMTQPKTVDGATDSTGKRLNAAIESTYPQVNDASAKAEAVIRILQHVHERLRAGLGELWSFCPSATRAGTPLSDIDPAEMNTEEQHEAWAQAISEHICMSTYNGAGQLGLWRFPTVGGDNIHDADAGFLMSVRRHMGTLTSTEVAKTKGDRQYSPPIDGSLGATNATGELCLPLCFACQQLSTWVLFTAGHESLAEKPAAATFPYKPAISARLEAGISDQPVTPALLRDINGTDFLKPGTLLFRKPQTYTDPKTGQLVSSPHVGVIIRTPGREAIQLLDSGGWNAGGAEGAGDHDTYAVTRTTAPNVTCGVMRPTELFPNGDVASVIRRLRKARPLGVAQLAIYERATRALLWASSLVPLHEVLDDGQTTGNPSVGVSGNIPPPPNQMSYPLAKLMASLRGCPHARELEVHWFVRSPIHTLSPQHSLAERDSEKTNNVAYVIRNGRAPNGQGNHWWDEQNAPQAVVSPEGSSIDPFEPGPYGRRPIETKGVAHIVLGQNGVPTVIPDSQHHQLEQRHWGESLRVAFGRHKPRDALSATQRSANPRFVDFSEHATLLNYIPTYFGGSLVVEQAARNESPGPIATSWPNQQTWGVPV